MAGGDGAPRTRLEQVLRQRHMTVNDLRKRFNRTARTDLSERQAYRWLGGELEGLPHPHAQAVLEQLFDEPASKLFGSPYGDMAPARQQQGLCTSRGHIRTDWEGQVIAARSIGRDSSTTAQTRWHGVDLRKQTTPNGSPPRPLTPTNTLRPLTDPSATNRVHDARWLSPGCCAGSRKAQPRYSRLSLSFHHPNAYAASWSLLKTSGPRCATSNRMNAATLPPSSARKSRRSAQTDWPCHDEGAPLALLCFPW